MTRTTADAEAQATIAYELSGAPAAPVVLVLGGISASRHVTGSGGWWPGTVGDARAIDTRVHRVLAVEYLDGGRDREGRPARVVTTHDQAQAIVGLLDDLGIGQLHAVVGASYGGMVALALAEQWPARVARAVIISAAHESYPMSTALRAIQRRIVELGLEGGRAVEAMALARALAMTTYRTAAELAERFDVTPDFAGATATFGVEQYLIHAGETFARRMSPERFLALSLSADLHAVTPEAITVPTTVVAAEGDSLVPEVQTSELARRLARLAGHFTIPTRVGHDAFLVEPDRLAPILTSALSS